MISSDVLVVGGGFAGLAAAAALSKAGATVTVLEALEGPMPTFRGELLHSPGVRALREIGLGDVVSPDFGVDVHGFAAFDGADRDPVVLPYASRSEPGFGFDHVTLVKHLRGAIAISPRTKLVTRARVESLVYERGQAVGVRCANGLDCRASLLVAADGRHSKVRRLLRIPTTTTLLSHMVIVSLARDLLPQPGFGHVFVGPPGPALAYPYAQGKVRMCIDVPLAMATGRERIASYVRERYARFIPGPLRDALVASLETRRAFGLREPRDLHVDLRRARRGPHRRCRRVLSSAHRHRDDRGPARRVHPDSVSVACRRDRRREDASRARRVPAATIPVRPRARGLRPRDVRGLPRRGSRCPLPPGRDVPLLAGERARSPGFDANPRRRRLARDVVPGGIRAGHGRLRTPSVGRRREAAACGGWGACWRRRWRGCDRSSTWRD